MRGENTIAHQCDQHDKGTSPRARGKHQLCRTVGFVFRNIPACAGKTDGQRDLENRVEEHPRVRGENVVDYDPLGHGVGTSPRARGKLQPSYA